ncbi:septal ring lytic transglycosylase RlpA family protein [Usitatibacter palustris]|uniref:Endolytic peptidoglycan transglycosylase RlpA n=1 Tax=Usitatibacter palustris TaxID=2732487 RepID=A0A6M4HEA1_9PROT|nr:septal ring lytic transglycosylase RlpA family protein [Usitatibacter palustris]QJR16843.1 Endolytic peptidoglycan transglycosylase RlpA [Usitatibacter palustris]
MRAGFAVLVAVLLATGLAGCGSTPKKDEPRKPSYYSDDGPPDKTPDNLASIPDAVPRDEPFHRFANRPYTVFGRSYAPVVNNDPLKERGMASWYGKKFHGQKTASGEVYDMFAMTAAHKTLPLPSYVRVTNVRDGRSVVVRVNDRGPFHQDRIIDLSYAAASRIGIAGPGSGLVEVERVFAGSRVEVAKAPASSVAPPSRTVATPLTPPPVIVETAVVARETDGALWLQLGAFGSAENAELFRARMARTLTWNNEPLSIAVHDGLHRVRMGPYRNREEASAIADQVRESLGFAPAISAR